MFMPTAAGPATPFVQFRCGRSGTAAATCSPASAGALPPGAPALPVGEKLVAEAAGRRNLPGHAAAEHGIGLAIAAVAPECSHALLIGPEATVAPAAAAAAVLGAPRIGDIFGACGFHLGREPQQAQRQHDEDASHRNALARRLNNHSVNEIAAPWFPSRSVA